MACSSCRFLDRALLSLLSPHHSTGGPSPKRYDKRYEGKVLKNIRLYKLTTSTWWSRDMEEDTSHLTSFSIDGERTSDTLSERRESILPPSVAILMGGYSRTLTRDCRASSLTCFQTLASTIS